MADQKRDEEVSAALAAHWGATSQVSRPHLILIILASSSPHPHHIFTILA
jgi:hypothetical protein